MDNTSILDQIITSQKAEEVAKLDAIEIINDLFSELSDREQDVVVRRHGLYGQGKETLESIGKIHSLTRERIRQIETSSIKKLRRLENLDECISALKNVIYQLLEEHGGLMEKEYLLNILVNFSLDGFSAKETDELKHKNYLNFMITKLLHNEFEEVINSRYFRDSYKLKFQAMEHLEELAEESLNRIQEIKDIHTTEKLIDLISGLESYAKHKEKIEIESNIDISNILGSELFDESSEAINRNKTLYSLLTASKKIKQNKFGHWGIHNWREITPKTINDKIYLVLKNYGKPMHFVEIAEYINKVGFDSKTANAATVHNELILDDKYILVGRGMYSLKEWGYNNGTVADVIEEVLLDIGGPAARDEIIDRVLERRLVKKATIILALMNGDQFSRVNGKYGLKGQEEKA